MVRIQRFDSRPDTYDDVVRLYHTIWGREMEIHLDNHVTYDGWRGVAALEDDDVIGFVWGYRSCPGQWFHDRAKAAVSPGVYDTWIRDGYELAEFGVHTDYRGAGIGTRLHDRLFAGVEAPTAVTMTDRDNKAARNFYTGRGWTIVEDRVTFTGSEKVLLGLTLPLEERS